MTPQALQAANAATFADLRRAVYAADQQHSATKPTKWIKVGSPNSVEGVTLQCDEAPATGNNEEQWWQRVEEECHALVFPVESVSASVSTAFSVLFTS